MEAADEWLLQSLRLYRDLHTFELQAPTRVIEWACGNRVCVAGYGRSDGNEILQLIPPPTLLTKETQGLCPERDFKVECGGFSERPVYSLKHVPDTSFQRQRGAQWPGLPGLQHAAAVLRHRPAVPGRRAAAAEPRGGHAGAVGAVQRAVVHGHQAWSSGLGAQLAARGSPLEQGAPNPDRPQENLRVLGLGKGHSPLSWLSCRVPVRLLGSCSGRLPCHFRF